MKNFKILALIVCCSIGAVASAQTGTEKAAIQKLVQDLKSDVANSTVTATEIQNLENSLLAAAETAHKPNPTYVTQLKTDIKTALANQPVTSAEKEVISKDFAKVLASAGITQSEAAAVKSSLIAIWTSSNLTKAELQQLAADVRAIVADLPPAVNV